MTAEQERLDEARDQNVPWKKWGPYLSERQWGTVREDYSEGGDAWSYFTHDQARSRAYRWGEDGLAGIFDDQQRLCFALALWNGKDPILKDKEGRRPVYGGTRKFQEDPHWRDFLQFFEYFHGDNGAGLGANHQTGWTGVVARGMHLFATTTAEQVLQLGKAAAFVETESPAKPAATAPKGSR